MVEHAKKQICVKHDKCIRIIDNFIYIYISVQFFVLLSKKCMKKITTIIYIKLNNAEISLLHLK